MKILLAYDGFDHSESALKGAADLAQNESADVTVVSVVPPDARGSKSGGHVWLRPHAHEDVARAHAYLRERGIASSTWIEHGDPAESIARLAREGDYDLVIVGSRARGPLAEMLLGSVSHRLVREAGRPVLVIGLQVEDRFEPEEAARSRG
jgi:nucleotide-binding universal stress UspA family protein